MLQLTRALAIAAKRPVAEPVSGLHVVEAQTAPGSSRRLAVERLAAALTALLGAWVLRGWALGIEVPGTVLPGMAPMKANTALCFLLSSVAIWFANPRRAGGKARWVAGMASLLTLLVSGLTLSEYLGGWNLGIDEALFRDGGLVGEAYPGRMAPNTAVAFLLLNTALLLLPGEKDRGRLTGAGLLGALTALLGLFTVTGYLGNVSIGYGWSLLTTMTLHTGVAFVLLGTVCLALAWRAGGIRLAIRGWLLAGFAFGLAVFVSLGVLSYQSARRFAITADWVRHTVEVLDTLRGVSSVIAELELALRGFALTGREEFLASYESGLTRLIEAERTLRRLTADNEAQQARLTTLEALIGHGMAYSRQIVDRRRGDGREPAANVISAARAQEIKGEVRVVLEAMVHMERDLLAQREADNKALTARTFSVLPVGTFIGLSVLLAVLFFLNTETTERKATAAALQQLGTRLTATVENMQAAFFTVDREWRFTYINSEFERLLHRRRADLLGKRLWDEFKEAVGGPSDLHYHQAMAENRAVTFEEFFPPLGIWLEASAYPSSEGLAVYFRDITERKRIAVELLESQARLSGIVTSAMDSIITVDHEQRIVLFNLAAEKMFRCAATLMVGRPLDELIPTRFRSDHSRHIEQFGAVGVTSRSMGALGALSGVRRDGEEFPIEASISQVEVAGQKLFTVILRDITERKRTEQALLESEGRFRFLNDLVEATRTLADPAEIMAVMARMLGEHLGVSRCAYATVENDGEHFTILHDYTDGCASTVGSYLLSLFGARALATLHGGRTLVVRDVDAELSPGDGADMFNAIAIKAIITCPLIKDGGLRAMMAVHQTSPREWQPGEIAMVQDVVDRCWGTIERRAAEDRVRSINAELEQRVFERTAQLEGANQDLEAFSYSVSHDLRAPLRTVDGFSQALLEDFGPQLPEEGQRQLRTIREGAQRMGVLIDDLLAFSQLGRQTLSTTAAIDMDRLVHESLEDLLPEQEGRQIEIRAEPLPMGHGDGPLLKQVWTNLLSNALKYTRKRDRAVVEIGSMGESGETVYFVRDNGTGFDMRYASKLFGVFQRLHRAEDFEGTGVGLAIVQRVVQRHGGRVWAESAVDRGATFYFTLPKGAAS